MPHPILTRRRCPQLLFVTAAGPTVLLSDSFTGAIANIAGRTPDTTGAGTWVGVAGTPQTTGSGAYVGTVLGDNAASYDVATANTDTTITFTWATGDQYTPYLQARMGATLAEGWTIWYEAGTISLIERNGGDTERGTYAVTLSNATSYTWRLVVSGVNVTFYHEGVSRITYGSAGLTGTKMAVDTYKAASAPVTTINSIVTQTP